MVEVSLYPLILSFLCTDCVSLFCIDYHRLCQPETTTIIERHLLLVDQRKQKKGSQEQRLPTYLSKIFSSHLCIRPSPVTSPPIVNALSK